jgi:glycyl-tRNA synthetase beta subunit
MGAAAACDRRHLRHGDEAGSGQFAVDGIAAGQTTYGHRFMAPGGIGVRGSGIMGGEADRGGSCSIPSVEGRHSHRRKQLAFAQGFGSWRIRCCSEVAGLVEWPVVLMGSFDKGFCRFPEVVAAIRNNQVLRGESRRSPRRKRGGILSRQIHPAANIETG